VVSAGAGGVGSGMGMGAGSCGSSTHAVGARITNSSDMINNKGFLVM
jgi:hypothetical protein